MTTSGELLQKFPAVIPFKFPGLPNVKVYFTTGLYGNISLDFGLTGDVDKKRRAALAPLLGFWAWTELKQVHGTALLVEPEITAFDAPSTLEADGACTAQARHALVSKAADCQQIMLAHKSGEFVAALHCGWKGNAINFPGRALLAFCEAYAINPVDVMAVRGPSLGPGAAEFVNFESEWPAEFLPWFDQQTRLMDLWSLTHHQLSAAGIKAENIFGLDICTYTFSDFLFSYRRKHSGRQAALIFKES